MTFMVSIRFVPGKQDAIAAGMAAEQARVRELTEQGVIQSISIAADRSHIWLVMQGESRDHIQQALVSLPLYPYMELELSPLMDLAPLR